MKNEVTPAELETPPPSLENIVEDFNQFLDRIIERVEKARAAFRSRLDNSLYYSEVFPGEIKELARGEAVERECRLIRTYLNDPDHADKLYERLNNISENIDNKRLRFRVSIERSTCAVSNEIENSQMEALHGFLFSPNKISDSDFIQEYCRHAMSVV